MSVLANRQISLTYGNDLLFSESFNAAANAVSPGKIDVVDLAAGTNTITPPTGGGTTPVAVTIIPPVGNAQTITLKGIAGDTGVLLHKTDPSSFGLGTTGTFVLTAGAPITGVRLIWS